jgi:hypothetical protein
MPTPKRGLPRALAVAVAAGAFAAGCGGSEEGARPASESGPAGERTQAEKAGDGRPESSQSSSITQRSEGSGSSQASSLRQSGGGSSASSQTTSSGSGVSTFSGSGSTTLSFNVEQPSRLVWTNSEGRPFSAEGGGISIDSRAGSGEVALEPGDYENVKVRGSNWTIVVRPR